MRWQMDNNIFDQLGFESAEEMRKRINKEKADGEHIDHLVHRLFKQSEAGVELLAIWERSLLFVPTAAAGYDLVQIGINEGTKQFIRNIKLTIDKVEGGNE